jgi:tetratricopeptide (TPR) repeat protein
MLYRANQNWLDEPATMPPTLLGETILALYQLGEFEYAESLQSLLAEDEDRLLTTCIQATRDDKTVLERRQRYQQLNDLGIKAYQSGELEQALGHFREALRRAPANTGAALNKIQVLLQLMQKNRKSPEFGTECKETLDVLDGIPLNPAQQERFRKLRQEFNQLS